MFAAICVLGAFIEVCFIPETKGKNLYAVEENEMKEMNNLSDTQSMIK
jgi:hypothetical protein